MFQIQDEAHNISITPKLWDSIKPKYPFKDSKTIQAEIILNSKVIKSAERQAILRRHGWLHLYVKGYFAGKMKLHDLEMEAAYVSNFVIFPEYQENGNGSYLLKCAIQIAKACSCESISLKCAKDNAKALSIYRKNNFFVCAVTTKQKYSKHTNSLQYHYFMTRKINYID